MSNIEERAQKLADLFKNSTFEDDSRGYVLADYILDELTREDTSFDDNVVVVRKGLELIEKQQPRTIEERLEAVAAYENFYRIKTIHPVTGETDYTWNRSELERYCQMEGVTLEAFIAWSLSADTNESVE